jgi:hypothetical protein
MFASGSSVMSHTFFIDRPIRLALAAVMMAVAATTGSAQQGSTYEIDGAAVIQYTPHSGANQQWLLRPVGSAAAAITTVSER